MHRIASDHLRYQQAEYRISIYGRSKKEWDQLADWIVDHELYSPHNRWLIQVPRLYGMYQSSRSLRTFGEMLDNIFVLHTGSRLAHAWQTSASTADMMKHLGANRADQPGRCGPEVEAAGMTDVAITRQLAYAAGGASLYCTCGIWAVVSLTSCPCQPA